MRPGNYWCWGGGDGGNQLLNDVWYLSTTGWTTSAAMAHPAPRAAHILVHDAARGNLVVFGGIDANGNRLADTWVSRGGHWRKLAATADEGPPRAVGAAAYAPSLQQVVLFGGENSDGSHSAATWAFDGEGWHELQPPSAPEPRIGHALAWCSQIEKIVLFGGDNANGKHNDTYTFDGVRWTRLTTGVAPSPRAHHAMVSDGHGGVLLFGGLNDQFQRLGDTWRFDGTAWTAIVTAHAPERRMSHAMAYDPIRDRVLLFGGFFTGALNDVWEFNGADWVRLMPDGAVPALSITRMAYDALHSRILVFGGSDSAGRSTEAAWQLRFARPDGPVDACASTHDDIDGDGLVGCGNAGGGADPDCWARCTPHCPPWTTRQVGTTRLEWPAVCDQVGGGGLRCGDGQCGVLEDYAICPGDCPP